MTKDEASALRTARDTDAKLLSRKPKHELVAIYQSEGGLGGGTWSKDDLVSSILNARFPIAGLNEAIHVLHHQDAIWPDCPHCYAERRCPECDGQGLMNALAACRACGGGGWPPTAREIRDAILDRESQRIAGQDRGL